MKWKIRLPERESEFGSRFVWWVKQSEAQKKIKELKQKIKELEAQKDK
jgi:uncharacterized membrane protein (DUF106 family)